MTPPTNWNYTLAAIGVIALYFGAVVISATIVGLIAKIWKDFITYDYPAVAREFHQKSCPVFKLRTFTGFKDIPDWTEKDSEIARLKSAIREIIVDADEVSSGKYRKNSGEPMFSNDWCDGYRLACLAIIGRLEALIRVKE